MAGDDHSASIVKVDLVEDYGRLLFYRARTLLGESFSISLSLSLFLDFLPAFFLHSLRSLFDHLTDHYLGLVVSLFFDHMTGHYLGLVLCLFFGHLTGHYLGLVVSIFFDHLTGHYLGLVLSLLIDHLTGHYLALVLSLFFGHLTGHYLGLVLSLFLDHLTGHYLGLVVSLCFDHLIDHYLGLVKVQFADLDIDMLQSPKQAAKTCAATGEWSTKVDLSTLPHLATMLVRLPFTSLNCF